MVSRRRFLFLMGGATTGIWLASTGLVRFERRLLLTVAGSCSYCGKQGAEVVTLVGTAGCSARICDECMGLCCQILAEEGVPPAVSSEVLAAFRLADDRRAVELERKLAAKEEAFLRLPEAERQAITLAKEREREAMWRIIEESRSQLQEAARQGIPLVPPPTRVVLDPVCSFCDRPRREVAKLISGPRVFICDGCVGEAGGAMAHLLRA
ncbi:MAG TPA: ClpX C4-type zinc finger protein [Kofleriaceae bacterium]|nr:ClpX C4-type zinc finger protein [Kofleriaceae bacterium]